jgi:hypothetical protein
MTVSVGPTVSGPYVADGATRVWDYGSRILAGDQLRILVEDTDGNVTIVNFPSFTVTGVGEVTGGTVTYPIAPTAELPQDYLVTIERVVAYSQPYAVGNQQGPFFPRSTEDALDNLSFQVQQLNTIDRLAHPTLVHLVC